MGENREMAGKCDKYIKSSQIQLTFKDILDKPPEWKGNTP
jgi:hypothetical protein